MLLNDPKLYLQIDDTFEKRNYLLEPYNKSNFYLIDGFQQEDQPCIVVLPPVMRNQFAFYGIKAGVLILDEDFQNETIKNLVDEKKLKYQQEQKNKENKEENQNEKQGDEQEYDINNQKDQNIAIGENILNEIEVNNPSEIEKPNKKEIQENPIQLIKSQKSPQNSAQSIKSAKSCLNTQLVQNPVKLEEEIEHSNILKSLDLNQLQNCTNTQNLLEISDLFNKDKSNRKQNAQQANNENEVISFNDFNMSFDKNTHNIENKENILGQSGQKDQSQQNEYRKCKTVVKLQLQKNNKSTQQIQSNQKSQKNCDLKELCIQLSEQKSKLMSSSKKISELTNRKGTQTPSATKSSHSPLNLILKNNIGNQDNNNINNNQQTATSYDQCSNSKYNLQLSSSTKKISTKQNKVQCEFFVSSNSKNSNTQKFNIQNDRSLEKLKGFDLSSPNQSANKDQQINMNNRSNIYFFKENTNPNKDKIQQNLEKQFESYKPQQNISEKHQEEESTYDHIKSDFLQNIEDSSLISESRIINQNTLISKNSKKDYFMPSSTRTNAPKYYLNSQKNSKKTDLQNAIHSIKKQLSVTRTLSQRGQQERQVGKIVNNQTGIIRARQSIKDESSQCITSKNDVRNDFSSERIDARSDFSKEYNRAMQNLSINSRNSFEFNSRRSGGQIRKNTENLKTEYQFRGSRCQSVTRNVQKVLDSSSEDETFENYSKDNNNNSSFKLDQPVFKLKMDYKRNGTYQKLVNELKSRKSTNFNKRY